MECQEENIEKSLNFVIHSAEVNLTDCFSPQSFDECSMKIVSIKGFKKRWRNQMTL